MCLVSCQGKGGRRGRRCSSHGELGDEGVTESRVEGFVVAKGGSCNARVVRLQDIRVIGRQGTGKRGRRRTERYPTMKSATPSVVLKDERLCFVISEKEPDKSNRGEMSR